MKKIFLVIAVTAFSGIVIGTFNSVLGIEATTTVKFNEIIYTFVTFVCGGVLSFVCFR